MVLADDIEALRDRAVADLTAAHDYFVDSRFAWRILHKVVEAGSKFAHQNRITGTLTTESDLDRKRKKYVAEQLTEATFQQFVSIFESFFFDLLRLWLMAHPRNLGGKKVDFKTILDAPDKEAITSLVVDKELNEILYERPAGWFAYLADKVKLGCPSPDEIDRIAEAKALRDALVHNRGVATKTYESKAGRLARFKDGEQIDISERYHRETWELFRKVVADVSNAALTKT